jgi:8-oxo-dGTP diphosphatase
MEQQSYVVGFLFSPDYKKVVLIRKNRPQWQIGKLNGVGGHVEDSESPNASIIREFEEETGLYLEDWTNYFTIENDSALVHFYWNVSGDYNKVQTITDETIEIHNVDEIFTLNVIPNLRWLIPMVLDEKHVGGYAACK